MKQAFRQGKIFSLGLEQESVDPVTLQMAGR